MPVRTLATAAFAAAFIPLAVAQDDPPQVERWELMDEIGNNAQVMGDMVKGEEPYDAERVADALSVLIENGQKFPTLFPEGTESGHDTRALPAIWENKADFEEKAEAMVAAARAAREPAQEGLDAFRAAFGELGDTCSACHTDYRAEEA